MSKAKELTPEQFRKMQLTELDMLVEFDKVCRKHNINYVLEEVCLEQFDIRDIFHGMMMLI